MPFNYSTRNLSGQQRAIISQREKEEEILAKESKQKKEKAEKKDRLKEKGKIDSNTYRHRETGKLFQYEADSQFDNEPEQISLLPHNNEYEQIFVSKEDFAREYIKEIED